MARWKDEIQHKVVREVGYIFLMNPLAVTWGFKGARTESLTDDAWCTRGNVSLYLTEFGGLTVRLMSVEYSPSSGRIGAHMALHSKTPCKTYNLLRWRELFDREKKLLHPRAFKGHCVCRMTGLLPVLQDDVRRLATCAIAPTVEHLLWVRGGETGQRRLLSWSSIRVAAGE